MNEQLKIVVKAVTDQAKKSLGEVKKELDGIKKSGKESGKSLGESMKAVAKGAGIAVAAIAGVTAALNALGKSTLEIQKEQAKLVAGFQAAGSSAKQATTTYKQLYRFMGDSGAATEAAQSLARITTNQEALAQWTKTLQGVWARAGDAIPVESLAEAANETIKVAKVTGTMADALNWIGISEDAVNAKLATLNSEQEREYYLRTLLNGAYSQAANIYERNNAALLAYNSSQAAVDVALASIGRTLLPLMTSLNNLSAILLTVLKPAFENVAAVIVVFVQWITAAIQYIGTFFGLFGKSGVEASNEVNKNIQAIKTNTGGLATGIGGVTSALGGAAKAAKELKKQTSGFDELNVMSSPTAAASGGGGGGISPSGGGGVSAPAIEPIDFEVPGLDEFQKKVDSIKKTLEIMLPIIGIIGGTFGLWKLGTFVSQLWDSYKVVRSLKDVDLDTYWNQLTQHESESVQYWERMKPLIQQIGGYIMIIAGALLLVKGYTDAWVNGIDWGNFALMVSGLGLIIGGIALAFSPFAAGVAAVAGGIALLVIGIKDFLENGYSLQNVLTILAGVIAVIIGAVLMFNAALLANPITWIVVGIAGLVAAFVILWNECEGFRNFWITLWEGIKDICSVVWEGIKAVWGVVSEWFGKVFSAIWESAKPAVEALGNIFKEAWELIKVVWDLVAPWFSAIWEAIKAHFSVASSVLGGYFKVAWEVIKGIWDVAVTFFTLIWENIKAVFSVVATFFGGMFRTAWEAIKAIWNTVVGYFTAVWNSIAGVFKVVRSVLSGNWSEAWEAIKGIVNTWGDFFKGIWESIKKVFGSVKTWFGDTFKAAWEAIKKVFSNWGKFFTDLWDNIKKIFSNVGKAIGDAITNTVKTAVNGVLKVATNIINGFIKSINLAISVINAIPGVHISKLKLLDVPKLAEGGIATSATLAVFGEQGKEAVLPLENNTEWMDVLADRISNRNNTPSKIVLMLNEKELGWANIHSINNITKQTGELPLVIV